MQKYTDTLLAQSAGGVLTPMASATVTVTLAAGGAATIYSDNGVTPLANPFTSDSVGRLSFYAADGRYTVTVSKTGYTTVVVTDILLEDPANASAVVISGGTIDGTPIGLTTKSTGAFTTLSASGTASLAIGSAVGATVTGGASSFTIKASGGTNSDALFSALGGGSAYLVSPTGNAYVNVNSTNIGVFSPTGLAVTGAISASGVISANGGAIAFPATQVPSSDPNTLDDYEEGTWTPVLTASGAAFTYTTQVGRYTKKGDEVTLHWNIVVASASGLGAALLKIDGSPFTANASAGYFSVGSILFTSLQSAYYHVGVDIGASSSSLTLFGQLAASTSSQIFRSDGIMTSAGSQLIGTITYKV